MTDLEPGPSPEVERRLRRAFAPLPPEPDAAVWAGIVSRSTPGPDSEPTSARGRFDGRFDRRLSFAVAVAAATLALVAGLVAIIGATDVDRTGGLATEPAATGWATVLPTGPSWWWHLAAITLTGLVVVAVHLRYASRMLTAGLLMLATAVFGATAMVAIHVRLGAELAATAPTFDGFEIVAVEREWLPDWDFGRLVRIEYRPDGSDGLAGEGPIRSGFDGSGFSTMGGGSIAQVEPGQPCWSRDRTDSFGVEFWCLVEDSPDRLVVDATVFDTDGLLLAWLLFFGLGLPGTVLAATGLARVSQRAQRPG